MGFLRRILSLGGKKSKKNRKHEDIQDPGQLDFRYRPQTEEESEAAANHLLRSSSARYAAVAEMDYQSLPPLPHPIDNVLRTPTGSTCSFESGSLARRGTYSVTVYPRERHIGSSGYKSSTSAEEHVTPRVGRSNHSTPLEDSQICRLRSDPSVASLLELYDKDGCIPSRAFADSPPSPESPSSPRESRAQCRRSGSTLRQLLGSPLPRSSDSEAFEGDISWAERFLDERDSAFSSTSSLSIQTPILPPEFGSPSTRVYAEPMLSLHQDRSVAISDNPTFSSMEVELSVLTDATPASEYSVEKPEPYEHSNPSTPQRASQVFDFLSDRQRPHPPPFDDTERPLPDVPSALSSPSDKSSVRRPSCSQFSDSSYDAISLSSCNPPAPSGVHDIPSRGRPLSASFSPSSLGKREHSASPAPPPTPVKSTRHRLAQCTPTPALPSLQYKPPESHIDDMKPTTAKSRKVKAILTNPTTLIVTAPTLSTNNMERPSSRRIGGPRFKKARGHAERRPTLIDRSNSQGSTSDHFTALPTRHRKARRVSVSSAGSAREKENGKVALSTLTSKAELPFTPVRSHSKSLCRAAVAPGMYAPPEDMVPSPASSTELSPVGRQVMMEARKQRMRFTPGQ
ncbi:uncharacterized protein BT62DRAFT_987534 [Guyanagaster necrorhizus]|uniref:Uncharacterized protein n=1 Tax=Guyanagaster necrorhizus TaxID=856835 RepID=A0A9P7VRZ5_9AGAR|nr:uncharacterized protein BT62DRAFT_987534 [Guyanagaster necrorhizus MCA 3950]KAG7444896.1 hypothetical protein BT62DRAFT_987534 [Guyanagaster necrorhizus MCA 3950]